MKIKNSWVTPIIPFVMIILDSSNDFYDCHGCINERAKLLFNSDNDNYTWSLYDYFIDTYYKNSQIKHS